MFRMRAFYQAYEKVPQAVAQLDDLPIFSIPWGHNALILEKVKNNSRAALVRTKSHRKWTEQEHARNLD